MSRTLFYTLEFSDGEPLMVFKAARHAGHQLSVAPGPHEMRLSDWCDLEDWLDQYLPEITGNEAKRCLRLAARIRRMRQDNQPSRVEESLPASSPAIKSSPSNHQLALSFE